MKPTPAQHEAAQQRREAFRALVRKVAQLSEAERTEIADKIGGVLRVEGGTLSPRNTLLCYFQCPTASMVGGFRQWLNNGRAVRKGEHGFTIWIPSTRKGETEEDNETVFLTGTVFDISQTEEVTA